MSDYPRLLRQNRVSRAERHDIADYLEKMEADFESQKQENLILKADFEPLKAENETLKARIAELEAKPDPDPAPEPDVAPFFVSGPELVVMEGVE